MNQNIVDALEYLKKAEALLRKSDATVEWAGDIAFKRVAIEKEATLQYALAKADTPYQAKDIARYIINKCQLREEPVSNMKLQGMLYYAWNNYYQETGKELFFEHFYAWTFGPVVPDVYYTYCGYGANPIRSTYDVELDEEASRVVDATIEQCKEMNTIDISRTFKGNCKAFDTVFKEGKGAKEIIPFELTKNDDEMVCFLRREEKNPDWNEEFKEVISYKVGSKEVDANVFKQFDGFYVGIPSVYKDGTRIQTTVRERIIEIAKEQGVADYEKKEDLGMER